MRFARELALVLTVVAAAGCREKPAAAARTEAPADAGSASEAAVALCDHRVPADLCTKCNPELVPVFQAQNDWCAEHAVPESLCLQCNPRLDFTTSGAPADWCSEHGVPETMCTKCDPKLVAKFVRADDFCRAHGLPASVCPVCEPQAARERGALPPVYPKPGTLVRLASLETAREAGLETSLVVKRRLSRLTEVVGQLAFDQNRYAQLSARSDGLVLDVKVDVGDEVKAGQPLVALASSAVGAEQARLAAAKTRLATATATLERRRLLMQDGLGSRRDMGEAEAEKAEAEAAVDAARAALAAAGAATDGSGGRYTLAAPFTGTVVARDAVAGKSASAGATLIEVADLSTLWAQLDLPETEAHLIRQGQPVRLWFDARPGEVLEGKIARVAASVDRASRTVRARVELANPDRALKAGAFLRAEIRLTEAHEATVIPQTAVQLAEGRNVVFVARGGGVYEPVAIQTGTSHGGLIEVERGLEPGVEVVTTGSFLLKTELLKDSIGAGCCEGE